MNRKGDNSFNQDEEKEKYTIGMEVYLKKKTGNIIFKNENFITVKFKDGIKESFIWHELFEKYAGLSVDEEEEEVEVPELVDTEEEEEVVLEVEVEETEEDKEDEVNKKRLGNHGDHW